MSFPTSPINGATTTVNGISYIYRSATRSWIRIQSPLGNISLTGNLTAGNVSVANRLYTTEGLFWLGNGVAFSSGSGSGITYTSDTAPHGSASLGDQWYNTSTDILYEYIEDGTTYYWVDVQSPIFNQSLSTNLVGNLSLTGNLTISRAITATGNIATLANLNVTRNANIAGNILVGNITITRNATVSSNLTVTGNTITSNIITSGNITSTGNISTTGNLSVTRNIVTGNITTGNLTITGNIRGNLNLTGNVNADDLIVTDVRSGNVTITSNLAVTGNLAFTGANVNLGTAANLHIDGGSSGYVLQTDGAGNVSWQSLPITSIQEFTATGGQTIFTIVGTYTVGTVMVFVNGIQMNSVDYTATSGTTVVLATPRNSGDTVRIFSSVGASSLSSGLTLSITDTKNFAVAMSIAMGM
jgi:cytoskeletal protein CcmA (bactofilin family)